MKDIAVILFSAILVDNMVLSKSLGICPFLGVSKRFQSALGMSLAVIVVMVLSSSATYPIYKYLLVPQGMEYMSTIVFILIIASLVQLVELFLKRNSPPLYRALGIYLPLITTNCAVLGVTKLNLSSNYNFLESIVHALGAGIGFMIALLIFASVRQRVDHCDCPESFKGLPITLVAASIVAMSFLGFGGMAENLFH